MPAHDSLADIIATISRTLAQMEAKAIEESDFADLSMKQIYYLETIARLESPTFTDLAETLDVTKPSITAIVNLLQRKGYVKRQQSQTDRRAYHIVLTEEGKRIGHLHQDLHAKMAAVFTSRLTHSELQTLNAMLYKVFGENRAE
ncbi:MAG: MarR family transcriptional regulator [Anaerolineales bacterium]|nr:MarR family transcriptional regulator [Anaerolineales bacterium]